MAREWKVGGTLVSVLEGDLTEQDTEAIVNAANNDLQHGGGVAGAISRRGGPAIQAESDRHGPVGVGEAAITGGGRLKAKYVLHAASMRLGGRTTADSLRSSMQAVFELARARKIGSLAVPAVGTGIARFPIEECAEIMAECVLEAAAQPGAPAEIKFVLYDAATASAFERTFERRLTGQR